VPRGGEYRKDIAQGLSYADRWVSAEGKPALIHTGNAHGRGVEKEGRGDKIKVATAGEEECMVGLLQTILGG